MTVFDVKGRLNEIGPGVAGSEAEAQVTTPDGKDLFVYAGCFEECYTFAVSDQSIYETMGNGGSLDDVNCMELYEEMDDAKDSAYYKVFDVLNNVVQLIEG